MKRSELIQKQIDKIKETCEKCKIKNIPDFECCALKLTLELFLAEQKRAEGCGYEQIDDDQNIWKCDKCGEEWTFMEGGIVENNVKYCVSCGLPVLRIITHDRDEDYNETTIITERCLTDGESE